MIFLDMAREEIRTGFGNIGIDRLHLLGLLSVPVEYKKVCFGIMFFLLYSVPAIHSLRRTETVHNLSG
uniref:Uncharacterized protein n=1 Tax=Candidatus Kentrum sp. FW TaxID=2126338 RepID=A0A450RZM3_9GAMM|nr:MAG: hypothetical protein BECKFW1821A_GA0114235_100825 [Candidatus Kentron sp. FW]